MKPKATQNLFKNFFSIVFEKVLFILFSPLIYVFALLLSTSIVFSQSNSCQAKLIVDHDLNVGSSSPSGTYYLMVITNVASSPNTFSLSASNINSNCSNTDGSSTVNNVSLKTSFADVNLNPIDEISVSPGQSVNFYTHITIPLGTNIKKWCCTQVFAESKNCSNYKVSTILQTYYSGPDED